jgi:hypothetical protein
VKTPECRAVSISVSTEVFHNFDRPLEEEGGISLEEGTPFSESKKNARSGVPSTTQALSSGQVRYLTRPNPQGPGATGAGLPLGELGTVAGGAKRACQWSLSGTSTEFKFTLRAPGLRTKSLRMSVRKWHCTARTWRDTMLVEVAHAFGAHTRAPRQCTITGIKFVLPQATFGHIKEQAVESTPNRPGYRRRHTLRILRRHQ